MPLFEYRCKHCEHLEEVLQKYNEDGPAECPECGKKGGMEKEVSLTSFQLKGGGWYKDLYASTKPEAKSSETSGGSSASGESKSTKSESKGSTKSESKPAAKADKKSDKKTSGGSKKAA